ncbi:MAG: hypothetical protein KAR47_14455 [Planctomycetes bacterium]|nr:hypothetical protein [Planctomycetota bacterium]
MRSRRKKNFVRFVSAVICLSMVVNCAGGPVLCLGFNGHVAVEAAGGDCCDHSAHDDSNANVAAFADVAVSQNVESCRGCVDIPLSDGFAGLPGGSRRVDLAALSSRPMTDVPIGDFSFARNGSVPQTLVPSPSLGALSSIILLI